MVMFSKEQQMQDKIYTEDELHEYNLERHNNGYTDVLVADSPFGKQYFRWLETQRIKDNRIIRRIL